MAPDGGMGKVHALGMNPYKVLGTTGGLSMGDSGSEGHGSRDVPRTNQGGAFPMCEDFEF